MSGTSSNSNSKMESLPLKLLTTSANVVSSLCDAFTANRKSKQYGNMMSEMQNEQMMFNIESGKRYSEMKSDFEDLKLQSHDKFSKMLSEIERFKENQIVFNENAMNEYHKTNRKIDDFNNWKLATTNTIQTINTTLESYDKSLTRYKVGIDNKLSLFSDFMSDQTSFNKDFLVKYDTLSSQFHGLEKANQVLGENLMSLKNFSLGMHTDYNKFKEGIEDRVTKTEAGICQQEAVLKNMMKLTNELDGRFEGLKNELHKDQRALNLDMHHKTRKMKKKLYRQNTMFYYMMIFFIAVISVIIFILKF